MRSFFILARHLTMLELSTAQRALIADKLSDGANDAVGALVFGQFLTERAFSITLAVVGLLVWAGILGLAVSVRGSGQ